MILFSKDLFGGIDEVRDIYSATCYTQNNKQKLIITRQ